MGHKGPVLRPRCIGPGRARTHIPFYSIPPAEIICLSLSPWLPHCMYCAALYSYLSNPRFILLFIKWCRVLPARRTGCCTGLKFAKLLERRSQCPGLKLSPDVMTIICVYYWPAAFWSQARKTGTSAVTGNDGGLSCSTQLSDRCSEATRNTTGVSWQFSLSQIILYWSPKKR